MSKRAEEESLPGLDSAALKSSQLIVISVSNFNFLPIHCSGLGWPSSRTTEQGMNRKNNPSEEKESNDKPQKKLIFSCAEDSNISGR